MSGFIELTDGFNGEKNLINFHYVCQVSPSLEGGSWIMFENGVSYKAKESYDLIERLIKGS